VELINLIVERIHEAIRENKPVSYVHLDSHERGVIAPVMVYRAEFGQRVPTIHGLEIRRGLGGVAISG
jgi:hypothetical protein